jgi:hypothetical protein
MRVSGGLVRHLGLQMYAGAVPAIAEHVSNAWDAMARNVWITIPMDQPLTPDDVIEIRDDGHGMTYDEVNEAYLLIGRDRRAEEGDYSRPYASMRSRRLQSRKGIGKLAGFGIANRIEVRTVANGEVSHFAMDYEQIIRSGKFVDKGGYSPQPLADDGRRTKENPGTRVTLSQLKITRAIPEDQFRSSMARRFTILGSEFAVYVNEKAISKQELQFEFRFPDTPGTSETVELPNGRAIRWWAGFTRKPIADEEARGFVVYVRGKLAQTPWFFGLSGGAWGQHGMQYMTGEVVADWLDETNGVDYIATDRGTVRWEEPAVTPLREWGLRKVRTLLDKWATKRSERKVRSPKVARYLELAQRLPDREGRIFRSFVDRVTAIPQIDEDEAGRDIVDDLVEFGYNALTNRAFVEIIRQLNAASPEDRQRLNEALAEWDVIEAVTTARLVRGRVEIIRQFRRMILSRVPEKPDMQDYLKQHPWLIDPRWTMLVHETSLDRLIVDRFGLEKTGTEDGRSRLDFFCLGDKYKVAHVVELKRPSETVSRDELDQLRDYVLFLRDRLQESATSDEYRRTEVSGLLVCSKIRQEDEQHAKLLQHSGVAQIRDWENLLTTTEVLHEEFLKVVRERAPVGDPRLEDLQDGSSANADPAAATPPEDTARRS